MRRGWKSWDCLAWRREGSGDLINVYKYLKGGRKEDRARLFTVVPSDRTGGSGCKLKHRMFCLNISEGDQALEQVAQGDCGDSILRDIQKPSGRVNSIYHDLKMTGSERFKRKVFVHMNKIPLHLLSSRLNSSTSPSLFSYKRGSSPLMIFVALHWLDSLHGARLQSQIPGRLSPPDGLSPGVVGYRALCRAGVHTKASISMISSLSLIPSPLRVTGKLVNAHWILPLSFRDLGLQCKGAAAPISLRHLRSDQDRPELGIYAILDDLGCPRPLHWAGKYDKDLQEIQALLQQQLETDTKISEEGGGGGAPGAGAEIPLRPLVKAMVRQAVPLQPMEVHGGAEIHLQPMEVHAGADIHPQPVEDPTPEQVDA
ncbi:hypothetical protein QYF61_012207 [Mycteria americana]|uniref:Uncharacterized protein n=1 Tax=Mycteria americana TaxID=33587 RepID=A0AAN7N9Z1_MYCAM|nr:hypothetical protein QYF61_012207 [Mycteria americana]